MRAVSTIDRMTDNASTNRTVDSLLDDLRGVFGTRLRSLVVYGRHAVQPTPGVGDPRATGAPPDAIHTLAFVDSLTLDDLGGCARFSARWLRRGLAIPLILTPEEFARSLDVFTLEYDGIIAEHRVVFGDNPFGNVQVASADLRRACEVLAKSHLVHLREAYVEAGAQPALVARVIAASAPPFRGLLASFARFKGAAVRRSRCAGSPRRIRRALARRRSTRYRDRRNSRDAGGRRDRLVSRLSGRRRAAGERTRFMGVKIGRRVRVVAILLALMCLSAGLRAQSLPELTQPVNDFARVIDAEHAARLDRVIRALQQKTGDTVVVATVPTIEPFSDINEYAVKLFENHGKGIGQRGKDNGILVVVAIRERRVRVEVGYDLEQFVTDGFAGETSRQLMAPAFRNGDYGGGLEAGVNRLIQRVAEGRGVQLPGAPAAPAARAPVSFHISPATILILIILFLIISNSMGPRNRIGRRRRWGGGTWSGWNSGVGPFGGGGSFGGGGFGGGFGGFGGGRSGGGGGGASW